MEPSGGVESFEYSAPSGWLRNGENDSTVVKEGRACDGGRGTPKTLPGTKRSRIGKADLLDKVDKRPLWE